ncbi:hypothetical protein DXG01_014155 [Tephrocybe rancida]|nr:hypothetical protein DXG01_014155 [Tephrocybe rancida]
MRHPITQGELDSSVSKPHYTLRYVPRGPSERLLSLASLWLADGHPPSRERPLHWWGIEHRGAHPNRETDLSLTANDLLLKFAHTPLLPGASHSRKRKGRKSEMNGPKRGGGVESFRSGEARMPGQEDDGYDGVQGRVFGKDGAGKKGKLRWNKFKWILFFANILLTAYTLIVLVFCLLTWFNVWHNADIIRVGNRIELIYSTLAASIGVLTSVVGLAGILLNNRSFLAIYTFMLWITFVFLVVTGYVAHRRQAFNLEGKTDAQSSRTLSADGLARIQTQLECCGYFSPFVEATVTQTCYARSVLPGCKKVYIEYEHKILTRFYAAAFVLVPAHVLVMVAGLLCSNHVACRFRKGMMPKAYRLSLNSMAVIMGNYANQLADQYGSEVIKSKIVELEPAIPQINERFLNLLILFVFNQIFAVLVRKTLMDQSKEDDDITCSGLGVQGDTYAISKGIKERSQMSQND